ncbi:DUF6192 family protein [Streptomyces sp. B21-083]
MIGAPPLDEHAKVRRCTTALAEKYVGQSPGRPETPAQKVAAIHRLADDEVAGRAALQRLEAGQGPADLSLRDGADLDDSQRGEQPLRTGPHRRRLGEEAVHDPELAQGLRDGQHDHLDPVAGRPVGPGEARKSSGSASADSTTASKPISRTWSSTAPCYRTVSGRTKAPAVRTAAAKTPTQ